MLSRLYDERVFTSSDDVVFSASTSQALRGNGDDSARRSAPTTRRRMLHSDPLEEAEDEESKSDRDDATTDGHEAPADDELDDEDEEDEEDAGEKRRMAGLKFPLQSPRHIASSQSYLHRQRQRMDSMDAPAASPAARRRHARKLLDSEHDSSDLNHTREGQGVVTLAANAPLSRNDLRRRQIAVQYHDHPMELVFLSTGEIRPRDECPPGLQLPATTDVRKLLDQAPRSPIANEKARRRTQATLDEASTVHITRQARDATAVERWQRERPEAIDTNGGTNQRTERSRVSKARVMKTSASSGSEEDGSSTESDRGGKDRESARFKPSKIRSTAYDRTVDRGVALASQSTKRIVKGRDHEDADSGEEHGHGRKNAAPPRQSKSNTTSSLESELRKEKKRVLEKMSQLLEEQGKTQALQHQVQMLEDTVARLQKELEVSARRAVTQHSSDEKTRISERDERIRSLSDELQAKEDRIRRLELQLEQTDMSTREHTKDGSSPTNDDKIARLRSRESSLAKQLEQLMDRVTEFHSEVECWKGNSRQALEGCDKRADVLELMDRLWKDFPSFGSDPPARRTSASPESESSTIAFLTKKLRQKEEALRVAKIKYVELKELCARKSIREADMQNYINEQRLRGNLVVRQTKEARAGVGLAGGSGREQGDEVIRPNSSRTTSSRPHDHYGNQEAEVEENDDDDGEADGRGDRIVRRPQVFINIKRSNQHTEQEPSPIEHVRLAPSPALAQRYRQQQQQQHEHEATVRQSTSRAQSGRMTRAATVASASHTLATRQTLATRKSTTAVQKRTGRAVYAVSRTPPARNSVTSRRPSQAPTLTSRPWV